MRYDVGTTVCLNIIRGAIDNTVATASTNLPPGQLLSHQVSQQALRVDLRQLHRAARFSLQEQLLPDERREVVQDRL